MCSRHCAAVGRLLGSNVSILSMRSSASAGSCTFLQPKTGPFGRRRRCPRCQGKQGTLLVGEKGLEVAFVALLRTERLVAGQLRGSGGPIRPVPRERYRRANGTPAHLLHAGPGGGFRVPAGLANDEQLFQLRSATKDGPLAKQLHPPQPQFLQARGERAPPPPEVVGC
jgi:hypothetical protein